jgi:hypothetical protein
LAARPRHVTRSTAAVSAHSAFAVHTSAETSRCDGLLEPVKLGQAAGELSLATVMRPLVLDRVIL